MIWCKDGGEKRWNQVSTAYVSAVCLFVSLCAYLSVCVCVCVCVFPIIFLSNFLTIYLSIYLPSLCMTHSLTHSLTHSPQGCNSSTAHIVRNIWHRYMQQLRREEKRRGHDGETLDNREWSEVERRRIRGRTKVCCEESMMKRYSKIKYHWTDKSRKADGIKYKSILRN